MSHRRLGLFLLVGSLLLVTPFMVGFSKGVEKSIFSAMATLTDVKETLESKRDLLTEIYAETRYLSGDKREQRLTLARKHYDYAADVHRLAKSFLSASSRRHPKYRTFWIRSEKNLTGLWDEIEEIQAKLFRPSPEAPPQVARAPEPAPDPARDRKKKLLDRYREAYQRFAKGSQSDLVASRKLFEDILEEEPSFHLARYWLSRTCLLQDDVEKARAHARRLLEEQPNLQIAKDLVRDVADIRSLRRAASPPTRAASPPTRVAAVPQAPPPARKPAVPASKPAIPARKPVAKPLPVRPPVVRSINVAKAVKAATERNLPKSAAAPLPKAPRKPPVQIARKPAPKPVRKPKKKFAPAPKAKSGELRLASLPPIHVPKRTGKSKTQRPIAVMIENSRHSRPQSGLLAADFVYEMPVEGGITRFMAVYLDQSRKVEEVGPVRSARHYFVHQVPVMDAIYAHCGGSTLGYAALKKEGVDHIDEIRTGWGFWRNKKRRAPHNLYTKLANVVKQASKKGFRLATAKTGGLLPVARAPRRTRVDEYLDVEIPYYSKYKVSYTYDPVTGTYARFINGKPHEDKAEGRQIAVDNVVLVKMPMRKIDDYGRLDLELYGRGDAFVYRGGEAIPGKWVRQGKETALKVLDARGNPVEMNPGRTWIHMVQPNRKIRIARRPLPPQVMARLEQKTKKAERVEPKAADRVLPGPLGVNLKLARSSGKGVPGVIATPAPEATVKRSKGRGIPGTVVLAAAPKRAPKAAPKPAPKVTVKTAARKPAPRPAVQLAAAPTVSKKKVVSTPEAPPVIAQAKPKVRREEPTLTAAAVPEKLRPLPPAPARTSKVWRNGSDVEYDLADFSLDSF